jgi:hypothetical protein
MKPIPGCRAPVFAGQRDIGRDQVQRMFVPPLFKGVELDGFFNRDREDRRMDTTLRRSPLRLHSDIPNGQADRRRSRASVSSLGQSMTAGL